ncbi:stalk domain-containing protein [Paenibacillus tarimensis]|uniref:stalk domain-containing protein n=1 Tax=Paenibacillus tarimensis TaxID=416012 RepID=UPI001EEB856C|nr:stalk domain-containing protein [Paenibacillus tarimensis]MCF2942405.1 copper amine oxidase N-terminal domain-containing protein [Paenibacillus tarimensis]
MKSLKWLLVLSLLIISVQLSSAEPAAARSGGSILQMKKNSDVLFFNGNEMKAAQPVTIIEGSAYLPLRGIAAPFGYTLSYDKKTRESVAKGGSKEIRFKAGSSVIKINGASVQGPGPAYNQKGFLMVPIRMWSNLTGSTITAKSGNITITWSTVPVATFKVSPDIIYAGQTKVTFEDLSSSNGPYKIIDERWEGRQEYYESAGSYVITRWVMDENGTWSEPYSVTITVRTPNQPPVADFATEKPTYRIGEQVTYIDRSYDDENAITRREWTGNEPVFFEPGEKRVTLEVEDQHGMVNVVTKLVTVTEEVLYTREEYNQLYTPAGAKYEINGAKVLDYEIVKHSFHNEPSQMVRSNSPEQWLTTGIAYQDDLTGKTRFMFHNRNSTGYNVKMYLLATNINGTVAQVGTGPIGIGGPTTYVSTAGRQSVTRYLQALNENAPYTYESLRPGETKIVASDLAKAPIKDTQVFSAHVDMMSDQPIRYQIVVVRENEDPVTAVKSMQLMSRDEHHVRGTFYNAERVIDGAEVDGLGRKPQRIVLGDKKVDTYLDGIDNTTGGLEWNTGNFGVLYKMKLTNVAPRTLIGINARGGHYAGAFSVNGKVVGAPQTGILNNNGETVVLHRTGNVPETVEIMFVLASGSNLPINMLFTPLPDIRW